MNYTIDKIIEMDIQYFLRKSFKVKGIERTEDIIRSVYNHAPKIKELYLVEYNKLIRRVK